VGHRALATNLSDLAAMGARPRCALVALTLPADLPLAWIDAAFGAIRALATRFDAAIVGGNIARGSAIVIDVTAIGDVPAGESLRRSAGAPGDAVLVTGYPGRSAAYLDALLKGDASAAMDSPARQAHLFPEPRVTFGRALLERGLARCAIDVSDGLTADLGHILAASEVGATLERSALPIDDETKRIASQLGSSALEYVLTGGEAYELLVTASPGRVDEIIAVGAEIGLPVHPIGRLDAEPGLRLREGDTVRALAPRGHDHFRRSAP
jgi:thiamine-monophosphate kinase